MVIRSSVDNVLITMNGTNGQPGAPGTSSYIHIKYSNDGGATFTANDGETIGAYIGIYKDFTEADSSRVADYQWKKIEGEDGEPAYTIMLSNENFSISTDTSYVPIHTQNFTCNVTVLKGSSPADFSINASTDSENDIVTTINGHTVSISVAPVEALTKTQDVITLTIATADHHTFTKDITWSVAVQGRDGQSGEAGISITDVTNYYLATIADSGITKETAGWTTTVQSMTERSPYLWNYEVITGSDGSTISSTEPVLIGRYGRDGEAASEGRGIYGITEHYQTSSSNTTPPSTWSDTPVATDSTNKYLWNYETITYTDNTSEDTQKRVIGTHGAPGVKGDTGRGIVSITEYFLLSDTDDASKITFPEVSDKHGWTTVGEALIWSKNKPYLWHCTEVVYENPSSTVYIDKYCDTSWKAADLVQSNLTDFQQGVDQIVDRDNQSIRSAVWENTYTYKPKKDAQGNYIYDEHGKIVPDTDNITSMAQYMAETIYDMDGITSRVSTTETTVGGLQTKTSEVEQTADKINWLVKSGSSSSNVTLTDSAVTAMTNQFIVKDPNGSATIIEGGKINANSITADMITANNLQGDHGWINLKDGKFYYGDKTTFDSASNAISWNGSKLQIKADEFLLASGKSIFDEVEAIETWFYATAPTTSNEPAKNWTTDNLKKMHLRDIYFDTNSGKSYRWAIDGTTYKWVEIEDKELSALAGRVATAETNISTNSEQIELRATKTEAQGYATTAENNAKDDTTNKLKSYSTTTEMNAAIETKANEIALSVTETEIAKIEIGGRNLLLKTGEAHTSAGSASGNVYTASWAQSDYLTDMDLVVNETVFTLSFDYEVVGNSDENAAIWFQFHGNAPTGAYIIDSNANRPDTSKANMYVADAPSGHYWITFKYTSAQSSGGVNTNRVRLHGATDGATVKVSNLKLELGNKATDWTPAPEDLEAYTDSAVSAAKAEIKVTTDGISTEVSKISSAKYVESSTASWTLANIKTWATDGRSQSFNVISTEDLRVGDTVYIKGTDGTRDCPVYIKITVTAINSATKVTGVAHGYEDVLPVETIKSTINQSSDSVKIQAKHVEIDGTAIFNNTDFKTAADAAYDAKGSADKANSREQLIYISKAINTSSVSANKTWVTNTTGNQNVWTTKRPEYSQDYPVLFVATQRQTVAQSSGTACTCTTPMIDDTITVIDGGNIITGTVTANQLDANSINASKILTVGAFQTDEQANILNSNIEIGGRNLLLDTNAPSLTKIAAKYDRYWSNNATLTEDGTAEFIKISDAPLKGIKYGVRFTATTQRTSARTHELSFRANTFEANQSYTMSFYARLVSGDANDVRFNFSDRAAAGVANDCRYTPTSEWQKYTWTFTPTVKAENKVVYMGIAYLNIGVVEMCGFKLEKGNKATDWTPAPEDVEDNINNLGLSGKNLLTGTNTVTAITSTGTHDNRTWRKGGDGTGTITHIDVEDAPYNVIKNGWKFDVTSVKTTNYGSGLLVAQNAANVVAGKTYTMSCYAKGTGTLYMFCGITSYVPSDGSGKITVTSSWQKYSATFTAPSNTAVVNANGTNVFFGASGTNISLSICGMMLEEGDTATLWSPAPEDITYEEQRIYYRSKVSTKPNGNALPTAWVTNTANKWNSVATNADGWSRKITPISNGKGEGVDKFLYLFTCTQSRSVSGNVTYSEILLDDSTTIIDGGNIITGTVTANQIAANAVTAEKIAVNAVTAEKIESHSISTNHLNIGDNTNLAQANENIPNSLPGRIWNGTTYEEDGTSYANGYKLSIEDGYLVKRSATQQYMMFTDFMPNSFRTGDELYYEFTAKAASETTVRAQAYGYTAPYTGSTCSNNNGKDITLTTTEQTFNGTIKLSSEKWDTDAKYYLLALNNNASTKVQIYVKKVIFRKKNAGELIVDGSITADKIQGNSLSIGVFDTATQNSVLNSNLKVGGRNLIVNTNIIDVSDDALLPRIISQPTNTTHSGVNTAAEHGFRTTVTSSARPAIRFGSNSASTATMNGLKAGGTYTISFDCAWKMISALSSGTTSVMRVWIQDDRTTTGTLDSSIVTTFGTATAGQEGSARCEGTFTIPDNVTMCNLYISAGNSTASAYAEGDYIELANIKLEEGNMASSWTAAPEDTSAQITNIQDSVDETNVAIGGLQQDIDDRITATEQSLTQTITEHDQAQQQNINAVQENVNNLGETVDNALESINTLTDYQTTVQGWMHFDVNVGELSIGKTDSVFTTVIDNDSIDFRQNNIAVAYVSANTLFITDAEIQNNLTIGKFLYKPHDNNDGGMSLVWNE